MTEQNVGDPCNILHGNADQEKMAIGEPNAYKIERISSIEESGMTTKKTSRSQNKKSSLIKVEPSKHNIAMTTNIKSRFGLFSNLACDMIATNEWSLTDHLICGLPSASNSTPLKSDCDAVSDTVVRDESDPASQTIVVHLCNRYVQASETSIALAFVHRAGQCDIVEDVEPESDFSETFTLQRDQGLVSVSPRYDRSSQTDLIALKSTLMSKEINHSAAEKSADEIEEVTNDQSDAVALLRNCFPQVLLDDLDHILKNCDNNVQWAINVLLDSGYEMCVNEENDKGVGGATSENVSNTTDQLDKRNLQNNLGASLSPNIEPDNKNGIELSYQDFCNRSHTSSSIENMTIDSSTPCCVVELSIDMATQLQQIFGNLCEDIPTELLSPQKLKVEFSQELATQIYQAWVKTQNSLSICNVEEQENEDTYQFSDESLLNEEKVIMLYEQTMLDEQYARQILDNENKILSNALNAQSHALSTKIKLQMLTEMFSDVDKLALKELFKANNYNLEQTVTLVCESLNLPIERMRHVANFSSYVADETNFPSLSHHNKDQVPLAPADSLSVESEDLSSLSYEDLRDRAMFHVKKRRQYFEQAQQAFQKKMASVATYYAQMGRIHDSKLKEANHRAAEKILRFRANHDPQDTLDLHGLHVQEAISALSERLKNIKHRPGKQLNIVTGSGKHSLFGPRVKPAVEAFLSKRMYKFNEVNSGMIQVTIL